jgi:hypothetical protein
VTGVAVAPGTVLTALHGYTLSAWLTCVVVVLTRPTPRASVLSSQPWQSVYTVYETVCWY